MKPEPISSNELEPFNHGFFTRIGGVSTGHYESLNCGLSTNDATENVLCNYKIVADTLGISPDQLVVAKQVHSSRTATIRQIPLQTQIEVDGMVTLLKDVALCVLTADCQPILMADVENGVIGVAHGGWKGTLHGIIENCLACMEKSGAQRNSIRAVIGPSICQKHYEVGQEVLEQCVSKYAFAGQFFETNERGRYQMDLSGLGLRILNDAGVKASSRINCCTYEDSHRFFSWRRSTHSGAGTCGVMISAIQM